ncbi:fungal-specific transcription factor domain-domain-containing protein [Naematelia encephala]|uniref:Fungal-specific transcription factor domain-domain-containing protein n=1 Tax=Naematelia encephala TaxID=71784 RepID=A0A1Y2B6E4_9TREE|nr:fungal-specific transcription factor domain-domain-containing protein [Naematelia encephala]
MSTSAFSTLDPPTGFSNPPTGFSNPPTGFSNPPTGFSNPLDMDTLTGPLSAPGPAPSSGGPGIDLSSFGHSTSPSGLSNTSFSDPRVLPPDEIVQDLIKLFFTHIHPWAPILSPTPTRATYTSPWNIVVHAIVVVTLRLSSDPRLGTATQRDHIKRAAKTHVLAHAIESTSIPSVQALAILALDLIGSEQGPSSWGILALLTRSAVHLGLTTEDDVRGPRGTASGYTTPHFSNRPPVPSLSRTSIIPPAADWHEDEERRRLFWLIFSLDRYCCVSTGWDFALPDFEIRRRLPCADEIWAQPDWFQAPVFYPIPHLLANPSPGDLALRSPLAYLVESLDLVGRAHTLQCGEIDPSDSRAVERRKDASVTLSSAARRWFEAMPLRGERTSMALVVVSAKSLCLACL